MPPSVTLIEPTLQRQIASAEPVVKGVLLARTETLGTELYEYVAPDPRVMLTRASLDPSITVVSDGPPLGSDAVVVVVPTNVHIVVTRTSSTLYAGTASAVAPEPAAPADCAEVNPAFQHDPIGE